MGAGALGVNCVTEKPKFESVYENFLDHIAEFGYSYATKEEHNFRFNVYWKAEEKIQQINAEPSTWFAGHNQFSTWTDDEWKKMLGKKPQNTYGGIALEKELNDTALPAEVDWRKKGAVNPVQNQGQCGSCWAFSSIAAMEGAHFLKTGKLVKLAEEQLKDCDTKSSGCDGGLEKWAFQYAEKNKIVTESEWRYKPRKEKCTKHAGGIVGVTKYTSVRKDSVSQLKAAVALQPTCIGVEADKDAWQFYSGGILDSKKCGTNQDHAVTAVGYGSESGKEYLLVRNSWGTSWGEKGYIRLAFDKDGKGVCGSLEDSVYPETN